MLQRMQSFVGLPIWEVFGDQVVWSIPSHCLQVKDKVSNFYSNKEAQCLGDLPQVLEATHPTLEKTAPTHSLVFKRLMVLSEDKNHQPQLEQLCCFRHTIWLTPRDWKYLLEREAGKPPGEGLSIDPWGSGARSYHMQKRTIHPSENPQGERTPTAPGMLLGHGRDRAPEYGASSAHTARTVLHKLGCHIYRVMRPDGPRNNPL